MWKGWTRSGLEHRDGDDPMSGPLAPLGVEHLVVVGLAVVALAVGAFLYLQRPTVDRATVLASLPWAAVGVALHALRGLVGYPDFLFPVLDFPWVYLLAATLGGLAWILLAATVDREKRPVYPHYFAVTGVGVLVPLMTVLFVRGGLHTPALLALWLAVPIVAVLVTYVMLIGFGLWMPNSGYFAGSAAVAVTFALALDGIGTAIAFGVGEQVAPPVGLSRAVDALLPAGVADPLAVVWVTVWLRLVIAVAVISALTALGRRQPRVAERGLDLATVVTGVVAANTFLGVLGGGFA